MIPNIRKYIHNDRAETNYVSTVVYILVVVVTLAVIMDVLTVVMTKQKLDTAADQVARQIQLAGKVDLRRLTGYPKYRFFSRRGRYERSRSRPFRHRKHKR